MERHNEQQNKDQLQLLAQTLGIEAIVLHQRQEHEQFQALSKYLANLLHHDPSALIAILYRIDVSEEKLTQALMEYKNQYSEGEIIASLLIERQLEKIKFKQQYRQNETTQDIEDGI